jgi:hypothetical protein
LELCLILWFAHSHETISDPHNQPEVLLEK